MSDPDLSHIHEALRHLAVPVDGLTADPKNARRHSKRNLAAIEASLRRFGFREPIVVQRQGMIVRAGNGRLEVSQRIGWTHVPAIVVDEADVEAAAFALADNRTAELADWDEAILKDVLSSTVDFDLDLALVTGFDEIDLERMGLTSTPEPKGARPRQAEDVSSTEVDVDSFLLAHKCPRCGMEFDG